MPTGADFEAVLDRRLNDFEKVVDAKLTGIEKGVEEMRSSMVVFVKTMSNLHKDYVPRTEAEREQERQDEKIEALEKKVEKLQAWRNYLAGGLGLMVFALTLLVQAHFWK